MRSPASHPTPGLLLAAVALAIAVTPTQAQPDPGTTFRDCDVCSEMVVVPAGSFVMGSPTDEPGRYDDEGPAHEVTIAEPFAIGVREVTFEEWDACAPADGSARLDGDCVGRVTRGGAYNGGPAYLRSAMRLKIYSQFRSYFIGFRVARSLAP